MNQNNEVNTNQAVKPDYESEIINIIKGNYSPRVMLNMLDDYHGSDIADVIEQLNQQEQRKLFRIAGVTMLAEIFEHIEEDVAAEYIVQMDLRKAAAVISELETDTAVEILDKVNEDKRDIITEFLSPEIKNEIFMIASYDEDKIGSKMTTNFIVINDNLTIKEAMSELVKQAEENDNISTIFVVDDSKYFYGAIDLKELITARSTTPLEKLIATSFPYVYANEDVDECIERLKDYSEDSIPVLDNDNHLLGVITAQNLIEVVDDEMGEDYAMLAGLTAEEDINEPFKQSILKRLPWLLILLVLGLIVSSVTGSFEKVFNQLTIIVIFQSLILDMAGNVGTQSLAVTIRVLMDEQLTTKQITRLIFKEMRLGFFNGIILGSLSFILIGLFLPLFNPNKSKPINLSDAYAISGCVGISLMLAMFISSFVGTVIPLFFKKIKIDPAVASGPLITTINDLVAVVTYYGLCWILLFNVLNLSQ